MNITSVKPSNHHSDGVKRIAKYSLQTRSDTIRHISVGAYRAPSAQTQQQNLTPPSHLLTFSSVMYPQSACMQTLPLCRRSTHNLV